MHPPKGWWVIADQAVANLLSMLQAPLNLTAKIKRPRKPVQEL